MNTPDLPAWQSPHGRALPPVGGRTLLMGILNVTPDSFSDGGELPDERALVSRAQELVAAGADVLDIGGESTRPGSEPVSEADELARVIPAIRAVRRAMPDAVLSVDTSKPAVARKAVEAGADMVNDVWGAASHITAPMRKAWSDAGRARAPLPALPSSAMAETVAFLRCPYILMHNRTDRDYASFMEDVILDLRLSLTLALSAGIAKSQLWLDPGFGFVKTPGQNLEVVRRLRSIVELGYPVLLGTSRKSTLGLVNQAPVEDRVIETAASLVWGIQQGCAMVRVHDVAALARTVRTADALKTGLSWKP